MWTQTKAKGMFWLYLEWQWRVTNKLVLVSFPPPRKESGYKRLTGMNEREKEKPAQILLFFFF